jgi:predicted TIM-barrel fold metal-dependent hydrolase
MPPAILFSSAMNYIDAHTHVWTDDSAHYPLAEGWRREDMRPRRFTPEDFFKHSRPAGVSRAVLIQMSCYYPRELKTNKIGNGFDNR